MNFNVDFTENRGVSDRLPATVFVAAVNVSIFFFILTEVQAFSRMNLGADSLDKVFVIDDAVAIRVKWVEKVVKVGLCDLETPVIQEIL